MVSINSTFFKYIVDGSKNLTVIHPIICEILVTFSHGLLKIKAIF